MATKPSIPKGTRDFGPTEMSRRNFILDTIKQTFKKYGFQPLETPSLENLSVLTGKYGDEGDKLLFKILNSGDFLSKTTEEDYRAGAKQVLPKISKKGLRYDLTVPFARYVVMSQSELTFPFRRYQIQPVWRADRPQRGRYQEFYQCDADVVGTDSLLCEMEIIAMMNGVLGNLGVQGFQIKMNNRKVLAGIAEAVGEAGKEGDLCVAIDKLDKIGAEKVNEELKERGFAPNAIEDLQPILFLEGSNSEKLNALKDLLLSSATGRQGLSELEEVFELLELGGVSSEKLTFDITLARGLSYYTGAIFEVKVADSAIGSISGGGRYDDLTGVFGLKDLSGVGFSFGVDRLYDVMEEQGLFSEEQLQSTQLLFIQFDDESKKYCLPLLQELRNAGVSAELYPHTAKLKKQMTYANNKHIPFVALAGSQEMEDGVFTLKDMASGAQETVKRGELLSRMKR